MRNKKTRSYQSKEKKIRDKKTLSYIGLKGFFSIICCFLFLFLFSFNVLAVDPPPDISSHFTGVVTDKGEPVRTLNFGTAKYSLTIPFGSKAEKIIIPVYDDLVSAYFRDESSQPPSSQLVYSVENGNFQFDPKYYNENENTLAIPIERIFIDNYDSEPPHLNYTTKSCGYRIYCSYGSPVENFTLNRNTGYASGSQWVNIGCTFDANVSLPDDTPVKLYMTLGRGKEDDAVTDITTMTMGDLLSQAEDGKILADKQERGLGLLVGDLAAGTYNVVLQIGADENIAYNYAIFTVFADAAAYVKDSLDKTIDFYKTPPTLDPIDVNSPEFLALTRPEQMFYNAQKNNYPNMGLNVKNNGGYFYSVDQIMPQFSFLDPIYVGLSKSTDTGTDWEAWIFSALGTNYKHSTGAGGTETLDFSIDGPVLSATDGKTYLDYIRTSLDTKKISSAKQIGSTFSGPFPKGAFRMIAALTATGADPRNPNPGSQYSPDYVQGLLAYGYEATSIEWDDNGNPIFDNAPLLLDENGALDFPGDILMESYFLLALEMANATPEEGYTEELRQAGIKAILPMVQNFVEKGTLPDDAEIPDDPDTGDAMFPIDTLTMSTLPLCFMTDDEVYGEEIRATLDKLPAALAKTIEEYGSNTNTVAVSLNTLVCAGFTVEDLEDEMFQGEFQSYLNSLIGQQVANGGFAYIRGSENRMATYQALGALVDLYNGKSVFKIANENYLYQYPQYTDEGQEFTALLNSLPCNDDDLKWNAVPTVTAARAAYNALFESLDKGQQAQLPTIFSDELEVLGDLEESTGTVVGAAMGRLPDADEVNLSDRSHVEAVRAAYDCLTEEQKAIANGENNVNISKLWGAERGLDLWDAKEVSNLILSLPSADDITALDRAEVEAARAAYDGLTEEQQLMVDGTTLKVLRDAERALVQLDAKNVMDAIDDLPAAADVRVTDKDKITSVRGSYDALSDDQKTLVTNYGKLLAAEEALDNLAIQAVETALLALPAADKVTTADAEAIQSARASYEALTDTQQEAISAEALAKLTAAEEALATAGEITIDDMEDMQDPSAWYYDTAAKCIEEGLFKGDANHHFNPMSSITRAEFAQVLYNYYKDDANVMKDGDAKTFKDVKSGAWYYEAVMACAKAGMIAGDDMGNFRPNQPILRQDVALVMMRMSMGKEALNDLDVDALLADLAKQGLVFSDFNETSAYAQKAMAAAAGVIFFGSDGKLQPKSNITRAEMAQVMYNYLFK